MLQILRKLLKVTAFLVTAAVLAGLGYRAHRQQRTAASLVIRGAEGIDEAGFVRVGGIEQWVQVRGERRDNPVLLFLHGGPGFTALPHLQRVMRPWERDFTIVHWDQRGAGKSYIRNGRADQPHPTMDQMIADGLELAEHVRRRLGVSKVLLVGYSWGSLLGLELVRRRPELFHAFVGTGQVVDAAEGEAASYRGILERVRAAGDTRSEGELVAMGPPPYAGFEQLAAEREILKRHPPVGEQGRQQLAGLLLAPGYSLRDVVDVYFLAPTLSRELLGEVLKYRATDRGSRFEVPLFFFQGGQDLWTPTEVVRRYLPRLGAPHKELVVFPGVGHHVVEVAGEAFLAELNGKVKPWIREAPDRAGPVQAGAAPVP